MRILVVLNSSAFFHHLDGTVRSLCEVGHAVKVLTRMVSKGDEDEGYREAMVASVAPYEHGSYDFGLLKRRDRLSAPIRRLRGTSNYAVYRRRQHNSPQLGQRLAADCPPAVRRLLDTRAGRLAVSDDRWLSAYRRLQARLPADAGIARQVAAERPDVVVACPFLYTMSADVEYARAALQLGIPTVAVIASWDNLSTKGTFQLPADRVLVWNEPLAREAQLIHAIPGDRIVATGAPKLDPYFELRPSLGREEFCARAGLEPAPYVLYLGSSDQVAGDETGHVRELAAALRADERTAALRLVVRPHPLNGAVWEGFREQGIAVFPASGQRPDLLPHREDYLHTLTHAAAVIGVNTTAFLEAAIVDRPCLTILGERHRAGQVERGHFHHLLEAGFLETVPDFAGALDALAAILAGEDRRAEQRRRFVASFIRPRGIDRRAGEVMAEAILETVAAADPDPAPIRQAVASGI